MVGRIGGTVTALAAVGDLAFVTAGLGLHVLDMSLPGSAKQLSQIPLAIEAFNLTTLGTTLLIAEGSGGLRLMDFSDPTNLRELSRVGALGSIERLAVSGQVAYVLDFEGKGSAADSGSLRIIDLGDPTQPRDLGSVAIAGRPIDLAVGPGMVYASMQRANTNVIAIDVSDPNNPRRTAGSTMPCGSKCVKAIDWVDDHLILVGQDQLGFVVIDVKDPTRLRRVAKIDYPTVRTGTLAEGSAVVARSGRAYVACQPIGLCVYDITDPANPRLERSLAEIDGDRIAPTETGFVGARSERLQQVSLADPASPSLLASAGLIGSVLQPLAVIDGQLLAGSQEHLSILGLADARRPIVTGFLGIEEMAWPSGGQASGYRLYLGDMLTEGSRAYQLLVGFFSGRLALLDFSDPTQARVLDAGAGLSIPYGLARFDRHLYVAGGFEGPQQPDIVELRDVSDPDRLGPPVRLDLEGDVAVIDGHLILSRRWALDGLQDIRVYSLANPQAPALVTTVALESLQHVLVHNSILYATLGGDAPSLILIDFSQVTAPKIVGSLLGDYSEPRAVIGELLFTSDYDGRLRVIDVSDPPRPSLIPNAIGDLGLRPGWERLGAVASHGEHVYIAGGSNGLLVLRRVGAAAPATPTGTPSAPVTPVTATATTTPTPSTPGTQTATALASPSPEATRQPTQDPTAVPPSRIYLPQVYTN